jgi:mRNA interferase RelE/StbE
LTTFDLEFLPSTKKEWDKLGATIRSQFSKKLAECLTEPRIAPAKLADMLDCYNIKLQAA